MKQIAIMEIFMSVKRQVDTSLVSLLDPSKRLTSLHRIIIEDFVVIWLFKKFPEFVEYKGLSP
jgi:hypothetical protein